MLLSSYETLTISFGWRRELEKTGGLRGSRNKDCTTELTALERRLFILVLAESGLSAKQDTGKLHRTTGKHT